MTSPSKTRVGAPHPVDIWHHYEALCSPFDQSLKSRDGGIHWTLVSDLIQRSIAERPDQATSHVTMNLCMRDLDVTDRSRLVAGIARQNPLNLRFYLLKGGRFFMTQDTDSSERLCLWIFWSDIHPYEDQIKSDGHLCIKCC